MQLSSFSISEIVKGLASDTVSHKPFTHVSCLIDTTACKDPSYGAIQVGLRFAIVQDAL